MSYKSPSATARGAYHYNSKLTDDAVRYIRRSSDSLADLGRMFGVSRSTVHGIRHGKAWRHVK